MAAAAGPRTGGCAAGASPRGGSTPRTGGSSCSMVCLSPTSPPFETEVLTIDAARAMYMYQAQIPEELGFSKGDVLAVLRLQDDGWWEAEIVGRAGARGLVPSNYLQTLD